MIPLEQLPRGSKVNTVFDIEFTINEQEQNRRLEDIERLQDELKNKKRGSDA